MEHAVISTHPFNLTSYFRLHDVTKPIVFYIEGDGFAWRSKNQLSMDPTPRDPIALRLASIDPSANVVYLARPCHYSGLYDEACEPVYWSRKRFSEEVIQSVNQAIQEFMERVKSGKLHLVGYSGGGAVATLVAARREDVLSLRTLAGNLDPASVSKHHGVSRLDGLSPMDVAYDLRSLPQHHFVGEEDEIIPNSIVQNFLHAAGESECIKTTLVEGVTHHKGWQDRWLDLLSRPVSCKK